MLYLQCKEKEKECGAAPKNRPPAIPQNRGACTLKNEYKNETRFTSFLSARANNRTTAQTAPKTKRKEVSKVATYKLDCMKDKYITRTIKKTVLNTLVFDLVKNEQREVKFFAPFEIQNETEKLMYARLFHETETVKVLLVKSSETVTEKRKLSMRKFLEVSEPMKDGEEIETVE